MAAKQCAIWGIKIWSLCDSNTGYMLHFSVYIGKKVNPGPFREDWLTASVVKTFMKDLRQRSHLNVDNFIPPLIFIEILGIMVLGQGTIYANRKGCQGEEVELSRFWTSHDN
jgi:hypothetical protein